MSAVPEQNRFAPPTARVDDISLTWQPLAGRGARFGAAFIDGLLVGGIYYGLALTVFPVLLPRTEFRIVYAVLQSVIMFVIYAFVQSHLLAKGGQTIGKKLLGLRIVRTDGSQPSIQRLLGRRYAVTVILSTWIPVVGPFYSLLELVPIFGRSRKCIHDHIADTMVIKA